MGELRRIMGRKKYVLCILALFVVNIGLFQYSQLETLRILHEPETGRVLRRQWEEEREAAAAGFSERVRNLSEVGDAMLQISIFSDEDSFSFKNIKKTQRDFASLTDVKIDAADDQAVTAFLEYREQHYIAFAIILIVVLAFFDERKSGLWQIVYSCRGGRTGLAVKRMGLLFFLSFSTAVALAASTLAVSLMDYGGIGIFRLSAQSVRALQDFTVAVPLWGFFVYYIWVCGIALFVEGLFVWGLLSQIHNRNMAAVAAAVIYGSECALFFILSPQNPVSLAKYLNLFFWLEPVQIFTKYVNIAVGSLAVNVRELTSVALPVLAVVFATWVLLAGVGTRPFYVPGFLERRAEHFFDRCRRLLCGLRGMGYEWYKCMVQGRGLVIMAVLIYILCSNAQPAEVLTSPGRELLNDFYAEHTGAVIGPAKSEYDRIRSELAAVREEWEDALDREDMSEYEREVAGQEYNSYAAERRMSAMLKKQYLYGKKLEKRGIDGWFINVRGFEELLGREGTVRRLLSGILAALALVLILSPVFSSEWQSGAGNLLRCTKKGRGTVCARKFLCAAVIVLVVSGVVFATEIHLVMANYPLRGLAAPVQNIPLLQRFPFRWSILTFLSVYFLFRIAVFAVIAVMCLWMSALSGRVERAYVCSLFFLPLALLSGVSEYMVIGTDRIAKTVFVAAALCVAAAAGTVCTYRIWFLSGNANRKS